MKRCKQISNTTLDQALGLFSRPSPAQVESAGDRVFERLESKAIDSTQRAESFEFAAEPHIGFDWRSVALAALALGIAVLGFVPMWRVQNADRLAASSAILETNGKNRTIRYGQNVFSKDDAVLTLAD